MRYIKDFQEELSIFRALGSEVRISILELLMKNGRMSMNEIATALKLSNGALTPHIRKLEESDLIRINADSSTHGNLRMCEPHLDKMLFILHQESRHHNEYVSHLRVGQYSSCEVYPTCGLSTTKELVGEVDDPRYFTHPMHLESDILWFTKGYVEYMIPCIIPANSTIEQISFSAEVSSEAQGSNPNWPSDIHFYLNDKFVGMWTSPGDFADVPGLFTPTWWFSNWNQYGLLKTLEVRQDGTFMDDEKISDVTIQSLQLDARLPIYFKVAVPDTAKHIGGLTIFGRDFGNYNQDIDFRIHYSVKGM